MKTLFLFSLLSMTLAIPTSSADYPYPEGSTIMVVKNEGPGCPLQSKDRRISVVDYMWGQNWVDESTNTMIWEYALNLPITMGPAVWGADTSEANRWCSHEWKFVKTAGYRLKMHTNGTEVIARYRIGERATVTWKITYYPPDGDEIVDTISVKGPLGGKTSSSPFEQAKERMVSAAPSKSWKTGCEEDDKVIKIKTEAKLEGASGQVWGGYNDEFYNRIMQTLTYTWEKCG